MALVKSYSGFFGEDIHVTWEYKPGECKLPKDINEGDNIKFNIIGLFDFEGFKAYQVEFNNIQSAANGNPLHISLEWPKDREAGEMGFLMAKYPEKIISHKQESLILKAGFFEKEV